MDRLTIEQRVKVIKTYYRSGCSNVATFRALRGNFGRHNRPTPQAIGKIVKKFEENGSVTDIVRSVHHRNARSEEKIAAVYASVADDPNLSICQRARQLKMSYTSLWRILQNDQNPKVESEEDLGLKPYKIKLPATPKSKQTDKRKVEKESEKVDALTSPEEEKVVKAKETLQTSSEPEPASGEGSEPGSEKPKIKTDGE